MENHLQVWALKPHIYNKSPQQVSKNLRLEAVDKIFSNNCVYSTLLNFIPFNLQVLISYTCICGTVEATTISRNQVTTTIATT